MGIILEDNGNKENTLFCNWWNWRPTLVVVELSGVADAEQIERMSGNGCRGKLTAEQARNVANYTDNTVVTSMSADDFVKLDGRIDDKPLWSGSISEAPDNDSMYGASIGWLKKFSQFCAECDGFTVY